MDKVKVKVTCEGHISLEVISSITHTKVSNLNEKVNLSYYVTLNKKGQGHKRRLQFSSVEVIKVHKPIKCQV